MSARDLITVNVDLERIDEAMLRRHVETARKHQACMSQFTMDSHDKAKREIGDDWRTVERLLSELERRRVEHPELSERRRYCAPVRKPNRHWQYLHSVEWRRERRGR